MFNKKLKQENQDLKRKIEYLEIDKSRLLHYEQKQVILKKEIENLKQVMNHKHE